MFILLKKNILIQIYFEYFFEKKKLMVGSNCVLNGKCLVFSFMYFYCIVYFFSFRNVYMCWMMFYFIYIVKEIMMYLILIYY